MTAVGQTRPSALAGLLVGMERETEALDTAIRSYADQSLRALGDPTYEQTTERQTKAVADYRAAVRTFALAVARHTRQRGKA